MILSRRFIAKTRKSHYCWFCNGTIRAGEAAVRCFGSAHTHDRMETAHYHLGCCREMPALAAFLDRGIKEEKGWART